MRGKELFTQEQRIEIKNLATEEWELELYYTFSNYDMECINKHRRDYNKLGFAVQLCLLRYPGWTLSEIGEIPPKLLIYIAKQLDIDSEKFYLYGRRENTIWEHLKEIRKLYNYTNFTLINYRELLRFLVPNAMENNNINYLLNLTFQRLRQEKIIFPAITTIERAIWESRNLARNRIYKLLNKNLNNIQKMELDNLTKSVDGIDKTKLSWLRETSGQTSPDAFLKVIERLNYIRSFELNIDVNQIHPNQIKQLSKMGYRYEPHSFRRFKDLKRYAILVAFILELSKNLIDQAFEIHNKQIMSLQSKGRKQLDNIQKSKRKILNEKIIHYTYLGEALIKARENGDDPFIVLEKVLPWKNFLISVKEAKELSNSKNYDYLSLLENKFYHLRKYTPTLLEALEFSSLKENSSLLEALTVIKDMNKDKKRKIPSNAPMDFINKRWRNYVINQSGTINRHYYELATLTELRNSIRSGDISIKGSRQYKDFDSFLFTPHEWRTMKSKGTRLAVSLNVEEYIIDRMMILNQKKAWLNQNIDYLENVNIEKGKLHIKKLEKMVPEEAKILSTQLYNMLPNIKLTEVLSEVANWTGFLKYFTHAATNKVPKKTEENILLATLMALGTNIGLTKMADATPGISYHQMANIAQWRMYEEAMIKAQSTLINFQHKHSLSAFWGDGTTSSSDGMRVQIGVPSIHSEFNPHYGVSKGATIYRFVNDQYSSFFTKVINTNIRDAVHVIDGLLHHESDLVIEEHYTDTAGYTDQIFGLTHILGFKFAPRLRDVGDSKLYNLNNDNHYLKIDSIFNGKININLIKENYDSVLRLAHSIREGKVTGSLIMGKIGSYAQKNKIAQALKEIGRIEKTIFLLDYISDETLRRRIQKGLNKGELTNALARALFFGKHGHFREHELQDQLQRASALNILINAIAIWNTVYLNKAINQLKRRREIPENLLKHLSPLGWEHINFLGEYYFDGIASNTLDKLRPLKIESD
jgi:TnpA family transposase